MLKDKVDPDDPSDQIHRQNDWGFRLALYLLAVVEGY